MGVKPPPRIVHNSAPQPQDPRVRRCPLVIHDLVNIVGHLWVCVLRNEEGSEHLLLRGEPLFVNAEGKTAVEAGAILKTMQVS